MNYRLTLWFAAFLLAVVACAQEQVSHPAVERVKNPETYIEAGIADIVSLDPAWAYDTASATVIFNVYETLLFWREGDSELVPLLAETWEVSPDGKEYRFQIKKGIRFHNGNPLTPEDVEYSLERLLVQDRAGGPAWLLLEPLLGVHSTRNRQGGFNVNFDDIDRAIEVEGDEVVFRLKRPFPPFPILLAGSWASILDREWCQEQGDWSGTGADWQDYNNPKVSPIEGKMNGTGPFMLERREPGVETVLVRNENYWRRPAKLRRAIFKVVPEWSTRKLMFLNGDVDSAYIPLVHREEVAGVEGIKEIRGLLRLSLAALLFNFSVNPQSPYLGSGKLDGEGIPPDFFTDKEVRLGFAYAFDWDTYLNEALNGAGIQPAGPIIKGLLYHNPEQEKFTLDLEKASHHFKQAWGGKVWESGFRMTLVYPEGNKEAALAADIFALNLGKLNPRFRITTRSLPWGTYLREIFTRNLPVFLIAWQADYPDPHNLAFPFMHSRGDIAGVQGYRNPEADRLVEEGINTLNPEKRREIYYRLQQIYHEDVPGIPLMQPVWSRFQRDWVQGWSYNPAFPGTYLYPLSKGY